MPRVELLGVTVDALTMENLNDLIVEAVSRNESSIIANHNLHSIFLYHADRKLRDFFAMARVAHVDGMPLVLWGRLLGYPLNARHRVTYVDWIRPLMAVAQARAWRVFFLGGKPGVAEKASHVLREELPGLTISTEHGYFPVDGPENARVLERIRACRPQLLLVGMGMPRQELWIHDNFDQIAANVILPAGACFDFVAGNVPLPPRWMGRWGLEWLFRLFSEPGRLWRRYLVEPWLLLGFAWKDIRRGRRRAGSGPISR